MTEEAVFRARGVSKIDRMGDGGYDRPTRISIRTVASRSSEIAAR